MRTEYGVLFASLAEQDAALIVGKLKEAKLPYRLEHNGATILVPSSSVYEMRLQLAAEGLPQSGIVGYEIFDKNNIGITDFVQKLNYKRALEGELARTIKSLQEISGARVHIMVPEPTLFTEQEKPATASVLLALKPGVRLKPGQIDGITHLVASSIEGLESENVTVVDATGNVLSNNQQRDAMLNLSSSQLDVQRRVESYLTEKVQGLLDGVVGHNNSHVRVTAELGFDQVERNSERYDPESPVIRSEQKTTEATAGSDSASGKSESTVTNYEINKTIERVIGGVGKISRLSVAVMVNGTYRPATSPAGGPATEYVARTDEEMRKLAALVRNAVGYDPARNDQVEVTNIAFDLTETQRLQEEVESTDLWEIIRQAAVYGSIALAGVFLFIMLRSMFRNLTPPAKPKFEEEVPELEPLRINAETQLRLQKQQLLADLSKEKPEDIARLIHGWIVEGDKREA
jgi:flagellar M-ring protein FliF